MAISHADLRRQIRDHFYGALSVREVAAIYRDILTEYPEAADHGIDAMPDGALGMIAHRHVTPASAPPSER